MKENSKKVKVEEGRKESRTTERKKLDKRQL